MRKIDEIKMKLQFLEDDPDNNFAEYDRLDLMEELEAWESMTIENIPGEDLCEEYDDEFSF